METNNRTIRASKNTISSLVGQVINAILAFVTKTIFINSLSITYLGLGGLFQSVVTVLNISELGIGVAIIYALYKPISENDHEKIKSLMDFYRKSYFIIGCIVLVIGLVFLPFIDQIIAEDVPIDVKLVFVFYIVESVSSYWLFAYKKSLLEAHQKKFIVTNFTTMFTIVGYALRICSLLLLKENKNLAYYVYIGIGLFVTVTTNIVVSVYVDKHYPYMREKSIIPLEKEDKAKLYKNVAGVFVSKFSGIMINSIDNILISAFIGLALVGIYNNYLTLKTYLLIPVTAIFGSMTAGVGDLCVTESQEKKITLFGELQFLYFWIYGLLSICLFVLSGSFIGGVWLGEEYVMSNLPVLLIAINFLLDGLSGPVVTFRDANGLYWKTKYRYLLSALLNGILSFLLIKPLGVVGVLLGTTTSILLLVLFDPIILFKSVFQMKPIRYYLNYIKYLSIIVVTGGIVYFVCMPFVGNNVLNFVIKSLLCLTIPNGVWFLIFRKDRNFVSIKHRLLNIIKSFFTVKKGYEDKTKNY